MIRGHKPVRGNYINPNATNSAVLDYRIVIILLVEPEGARLSPRGAANLQ
jgi:hypothetical protein